MRIDLRPQILWVVMFVAVVVSGCGGGNREVGGEGIDFVVPGVEILRQDGLVAELKTDKAVYTKGESVHLQLWITNTGTRTRVLDLRPTFNEPGRETYLCGLYRYIPGLPAVWWYDSFELIKKNVLPGQQICLVDRQSTPLADTGHYDASLELQNLYVDGQMPKSYHNATTFTVENSRPFDVE